MIKFKDYCEDGGSEDIADCRFTADDPAWPLNNCDDHEGCRQPGGAHIDADECEGCLKALFYTASLWATTSLSGGYDPDTCCNMVDREFENYWTTWDGGYVWDAGGFISQIAYEPWGLRRVCGWGSGASVKITSILPE